MRRIYDWAFLKANIDLGLLLIRVGIGVSLFIDHGWEKITNHAGMVPRYPDPVGLGREFSLYVATISDALGSVLLILGFLTRPMSLYFSVNVAVAFLLVFHARIHPPGETAWVYFWWGVLLLFAGPGRYSLDYWLFKRKKSQGD